MQRMAQQTPGGRKMRTFRLSWLRLYAALAFWVFLIVSVPFTLALITRAMPAAFLAAALLPGLAFVLLAVVLLSFCCPTRLNESEVRGFNFWGLPGRMAWDEIASATPSRLFGLPWMIVRSHRTRNALWLPLFYADPQGFWNTVAEFAPNDSPLRSFGALRNTTGTSGPPR